MHQERAIEAAPLSPRVFGSPGASLVGAPLQQARAHQGRLGEERLAALTLEVVHAAPEMYLFHSVKLPGETGDVDQLLYANGTFYLMDAKLWKGFDGERRVVYDVAMRDSDTVVFVRDGQPFAGGAVKAPRQVERWRRYLGTPRVVAVVVLMDPGAWVGASTRSAGVVVLSGLEVQSWLRGLRVAQPEPLPAARVHELAGLAFDPATRPPRPASQPRRPTAPPTRPSSPAVQIPVVVRHPVVPMPQRAPVRAPLEPLGVAALIGAILAWVCLPFGYPLAIAALVLGIRGRMRAQRWARRKRQATVAVWLAAAHLLVFAPALLLWIAITVVGR